MFTINQHKTSLRTLLLGLSVWSIIAIIAATTAFIALKGDQPTLWFNILKPMLMYYYTWGLYSVVIFQLVLTRHSILSTPAAQLIVHLLSALMVTLVLARITHPDNWQNWLFGERSVGFWLLCSFIYLFIFIAATVVKKSRQLRLKEKQMAQVRLRSSQLENQLSLAQIDALKMQINPHFLFNALNSIAALIELESNTQAYRTTELLGDLLRSTLSHNSESQIPLKDELTFVNRYIELEQVRFSERFKFTQSFDPKAENALLPALILQPLIENSFKHGIGKSNQTVDVELSITIENQQLYIQLTDNASKDQSLPIEEGYGLSNIRKRLSLMYDDKATFELSRCDDGRFINALSIPFNTH